MKLKRLGPPMSLLKMAKSMQKVNNGFWKLPCYAGGMVLGCYFKFWGNFSFLSNENMSFCLTMCNIQH
jgi:hypothetical protein